MPEIILVLPGQSVALSPEASGFAHGFGFFETMRYAEGQLHAWSDHWARLQHSAGTFELPLPAEAEVIDALKAFVDQADLLEATIKLSLLKGPGDSQLFVYTRPPLPLPESRRLWLDLETPIYERSPLAGHKTHNYMESMHCLGRARSRGYADALRLDSQGRLAEASTANCFFIMGGRLCTPAADTGILPGVTRARLLRSPELAVETGHYTLDDLQAAEAFFTTNATHGIQIMDRLDGLPGGTGIDFNNAHPALEKIRAIFQAAGTGIRLR